MIQLDQHADFSDGKDTAGTVNGSPEGAAVNPLEPGRIDGVFLGSDAAGVNYNFGEIIIPVEIHGNVHLSTREGDCFGENVDHPPIEGALVELYDSQGRLVASTRTDPNGDYWFTNLDPGTYQLREYTPAELHDGGEQIGRIDGAGDTAAAVTGTDETTQTAGRPGYDEVSGIRLKSGQVGRGYDFCEHEPIEIAGFVYHDLDHDGVFDGDETGIDGATVSLYRITTQADGTIVEQVLLGQSGHRRRRSVSLHGTFR